MMFLKLRYVALTLMFVLMLPLAGICRKKTVLNKTFPYEKYSTIKFLPGDSCLISSVHAISLVKWKYSHDTIVVSSAYKMNQIENVRSEAVPKDGDMLIVNTNNLSKLTIIHFLDGEYKEVKKLVMAFGNEIKNDGSFKYFTVNIHKGNSAPQPLRLKKGGVLSIYIDYPSAPDYYPYNLYEKYKLVKGKLVKVG